MLFKYCEKHNVDIKAVIEAGNYAIFRSIAFKENYYNVKSLLETSEKVGADINKILKIHGYRMFQHAIEGGDSDVVNLLLDLSYKHNLDVKATLEQSHYKALQWIAQSHNANIAKLLIKFAKKKEINLKAVLIMNNYKALQLAARNINSEILDLFLQELTNIKESEIIALLHKIFDTIHIFPKRSIIITLSHFIDLIETKDQKLEFNWFQYDRLNSLLKNSIFQNVELSEVNRYSIISPACKLAVLRKNVPGFLASKEEIEKWNDPNGVRKSQKT